MNLLIPRFRLAWLPAMLGYSVLGALLAGCYGIVHDQVTYSISREYFTRLKFVQFRYADVGFPPRLLVAEIGFLATWWVGFIAAWFLARVAVGRCEPAQARRLILRGFAIVLGYTVVAGLFGYVAGWVVASHDLSYWEGF